MAPVEQTAVIRKGEKGAFMAFEKYVLCFDRKHTATAEMLAAKFAQSPELVNDVSTNPTEHIEKCVYNPNLSIVPYLDGKIRDPDKFSMRKIIQYTRFKYYTHFDVNYASKEFPVVTDHYSLPIFNAEEEAIVLKYITTNNGFRNIKKVPFVESEWCMKKLKYLPEVEEMYSRFMEAK